MRNLILVALVSGMVVAVLALWEKSTVFATSAEVLPASEGMAPLDLTRAAKNLPVEVVHEPY